MNREDAETALTEAELMAQVEAIFHPHSENPEPPPDHPWVCDPCAERNNIPFITCRRKREQCGICGGLNRFCFPR